MGALFETQHNIHMENCSINFFPDFVKNLWLTEGFYPFFILAKNFATFACYVVNYQNMMSGTNVIARYKEGHEITMGNMKKLWLN